MGILTDWEKPVELTETRKKPYVIFYGEGGGVRALLPLGVLAKIREMRDQHFIHGVDCLAGPSTASIYMSGFNRADPKNPLQPLRSEQEMIDLYRVSCPEIFHLHHIRRHIPGAKYAGMNKYDPAILENFLEQLLGDMAVSDGMKSQLVPAKALKGKNIRFVSMKETPEANFLAETPLYQAVMSSCMHPGCFPSYRMETPVGSYDFIDGGLFEHPLFLYQEVKKMLPEGADIHMVYMSTGTEPHHKFDAKKFSAATLMEQFSIRHGMPLAAEKTTGVFKEGMRHLRAELGSNFIELEFNLDEIFPANAVPIVDDVTLTTLEAYETATQKLIDSRIDVIRQISDLLNYRETWDTNQAENLTIDTQNTETISRGLLDRIIHSFGGRKTTSAPIPTTIH
ncbi:MAG: patatin-like phospholipase family protein [Pseudomonadota bacterium]